MATSQTKGLLTLNEQLRKIEREVNLSSFYGEGYAASELAAKPLVLVIGQYSTGKTTFISTLCGGEYDGCHIGPEPTTEKFVAVVGVPKDQPKASKRGNYVSMMPSLPFGGLAQYGQGFLSRFVAAFHPQTEEKTEGHNLAQTVTFVDTPGVLSGEKQRISRSYDFAEVSRWFAERSELVLLVFDAHKLDISDEFRQIIEGLRGYESRVRCVLNKADQVDAERLVRVYGALMFNIGKILRTPEVIRVFIGSFWDEPLRHAEYEKVFDKDRKALVDEISHLQHTATARKVDDLVRRGRLCLLHCRLCNHILDTYAPSLSARLLVPGSNARAKAKCIAEIDAVYTAVLQKYGKEVSRGDLPPKEVFVAGLEKLASLHELPRTEESTTIDDVKYWLAESVPRITEPSDSPEVSRPKSFDDDRFNLSREAKRRRASASSSLGAAPLVAVGVVGLVGVGIAFAGDLAGARALLDGLAARLGDLVAALSRSFSGAVDQAREAVSGLGGAPAAAAA